MRLARLRRHQLRHGARRLGGALGALLARAPLLVREREDKRRDAPTPLAMKLEFAVLLALPLGGLFLQGWSWWAG